MVEYSNPQPPEGINASLEHPAKEFLTLVIGIAVALALIALVLSFSAGWLASRLPFKYEQGIGDTVFASESWHFSQQAQLQSLVDRLRTAMQTPDDIPIQVHWSMDESVNAFAFLGGHIVVHRGLLEKLESENALAMVLAHEMAHVQHRDAAKSLGRGIALGILFSVILGDADGLSGQILAQGANSSLLSFSRSQERAADEAALAAVNRLYGHIDGALQLYRVLEESEQERGVSWQVEFLSTHPETGHRVEYLIALAQREAWLLSGPLTSMPSLASQPE